VRLQRRNEVDFACALRHREEDIARFLWEACGEISDNLWSLVSHDEFTRLAFDLSCFVG